MKASEILRRALTRFDGGRLWIKGAFGSEEIGFCSSGALLNVDDAADCGSTPYVYLQRAIGKASLVCGWNDEPSRTFADVEAAFQKAIQIAEAEGN